MKDKLCIFICSYYNEKKILEYLSLNSHNQFPFIFLFINTKKTCNNRKNQSQKMEINKTKNRKSTFQVK